MAVPHISKGTRVTADDWWNPLTDLVNANESGVSQINVLLDKLVANGGISDLATLITALQSADTASDADIAALQAALGMPWTGGTVQARITALETASGTAAPYCVVYNGSGFSLSSASGDLYAQGGWSAYKDANSMFFAGADAGYSYIEIPSAGEWRVEYLSNHDNTTGFGACFVTKNSRAFASSVARDVSPTAGSGGDMLWLHADNEVTLAANDRLYWGDFTSVGCNVRGSLAGMKSCKVTVRKLSDA